MSGLATSPKNDTMVKQDDKEIDFDESKLAEDNDKSSDESQDDTQDNFLEKESVNGADHKKVSATTMFSFSPEDKIISVKVVGNKVLVRHDVSLTANDLKLVVVPKLHRLHVSGTQEEFKKLFSGFQYQDRSNDDRFIATVTVPLYDDFKNFLNMKVEGLIIRPFKQQYSRTTKYDRDVKHADRPAGQTTGGRQRYQRGDFKRNDQRNDFQRNDFQRNDFQRNDQRNDYQRNDYQRNDQRNDFQRNDYQRNDQRNDFQRNGNPRSDFHRKNGTARNSNQRPTQSSKYFNQH
jgi:hypothetical protein